MMRRAIALIFVLLLMTLLAVNASAIDIIRSDDEANELFYEPLIPYQIVAYQNYDNGLPINTAIIGVPIVAYNTIQSGISTDVYNDITTSVSDSDGYGNYGNLVTYFKDFENYGSGEPYIWANGSYCVSGRLYPQSEDDSSSNAFNRYEITFDDYYIDGISYLFNDYEFVGKPYEEFELPYTRVNAVVSISFDVETTTFDGTHYKEVSYRFFDQFTYTPVANSISFGDYEFDDFTITDNNIKPDTIPNVEFFRQNENGYDVRNMSIIIDLSVPNDNADSDVYNTTLSIQTNWLNSNVNDENGGYGFGGVYRYSDSYKELYLRYRESSEYYKQLYEGATSGSPLVKVPSLFLSAVGEFFAIDFFGMGFTLGHLTFVIALCSVVLIFLKMFAGG